MNLDFSSSQYAVSCRVCGAALSGDHKNAVDNKWHGYCEIGSEREAICDWASDVCHKCFGDFVHSFRSEFLASLDFYQAAEDRFERAALRCRHAEPDEQYHLSENALDEAYARADDEFVTAVRNVGLERFAEWMVSRLKWLLDRKKNGKLLIRCECDCSNMGVTERGGRVVCAAHARSKTIHFRSEKKANPQKDAVVSLLEELCANEPALLDAIEGVVRKLRGTLDTPVQII